MKKIVFVFAFLFVFTHNLFGFFSSPKALVLPLVPKEQSAPWIGIALEELIEDDIKSLDDFELVSISSLQNDEENPLMFATLFTMSKEEAQSFAKERDIELLVGGSYLLDGDTLRVTLWVESQNKHYTKTLELFYAQIIEEFTRKWYGMTQTIENLSGASLDDFYANNPNSLIALQYYAKGLQELYTYVDTKLNAKAKVNHLNNGGKAELLAQMKAKQAEGQNMAALVQMMKQLNNKVKNVAHAFDETLSKEYLYKATYYFKEAIATDKEFGPSYAQLANIIHASSVESPYSVPPKSYVEDLCAQAEDAKVKAECRDDVTEYEEVPRGGGGDMCSDASRVLESFRKYVTQPTKRYNYTAYLDRVFEDVEMHKDCFDRGDLEEILDEGTIALEQHFQGRLPQKFVRYEYKMAGLYNYYGAREKGFELDVKLMKFLKTLPKTAKKPTKSTSAQDEMMAQMQAKMQAALGMKISQIRKQMGTDSQIDNLSFNEKYILKIAQKLALYYAQHHEAVKAKKYLAYLEPYSLKDLDEIIDALTISKIYYYLGEYKQALEKAKVVVALREKNDMGRMGGQKKFIDLYLYMAQLYSYNDNFKEAMKYAKKVSQKIANIREFITPDDDETLALLQEYTQKIDDVMLLITLKQNNTQDFEKLYAKIADKKAQRLYTNNAMHSMINTQLNRSLKPLLQKLQTQQKELVLFQEGSEEKRVLQEKIHNLKQKLLVIENMNHVIDRENALKASSLYKNLPQDTVVLDFFTTQDRYYMFVVHKGKIELRDVGSKEEIDALIQDKEFVKSSSLYEHFFAKGAPKESKWIVIPQERLYLLPFEAMKTPSNHYLIEEKTISYLPSVLMLKPTKQSESIHTMTLFANPDYEQNPPSQTNVNQDRTLRGVSFTPLPGTMLEAKKIQKVVQKAGIELKLYTQKDANEENFAKESDAEVLHVATHGYFVPSSQGYKATGIVLSGANTSIKKGIDAGIVSAQKILDYYNYANTKLVVLSACDTGAGKLSTIDTVQSLGNSFMMVGASRVMMNLWEIPDIQTAYIMKLFYKNLFIKHMKVDEALREAKLSMIKRDEPYDKWAALVLFGN